MDKASKRENMALESPLLQLPTEILLGVMSHLDLETILLLRSTSKLLYTITTDKSIWLRIILSQKPRIPLLHLIQTAYQAGSLTSLPSPILELHARRQYRTDQLWLHHRLHKPLKLHPTNGGKHLLEMELFADRWLLAVYSDGFVYLWDTNSISISDSPPEPYAYMDLGYSGCTSYSAQYDSESGNLVFALTREPPASITSLYQISLPDTNRGGSTPSNPTFKLIHVFTLLTKSLILRQINISQRMIIFSQFCDIEVLTWGSSRDAGADAKAKAESKSEAEAEVEAETVTDSSDPDETMTQISTEADGIQEMFTKIIALRYIHPYILAFKTRSIELHPFPFANANTNTTTTTTTTSSSSSNSTNATNANNTMNSAPAPTPTPPTPPTLRHDFPNLTFRTVSISSARHTSSTLSRTISLSILAHDVMLGIFLFDIRIVLPPITSLDSQPRSIFPTGIGMGYEYTLDVRLTSIYAMADNIRISPSHSLVHTTSASASASATYTTDNTNTPHTHTHTHTHPTNALTSISQATLTPTSTGSVVTLQTPLPGGTLSPLPSPSTTTTTTIPSTSTITTATTSSGIHHDRDRDRDRDRDPTSYGFVSALTLGPRGLRAAWIERWKGSMVKRVVACRIGVEPRGGASAGAGGNAYSNPNPKSNSSIGIPDEEGGEGDEGEDEDSIAVMHSQAVYSSHSYDLREGWTHCAFAEASGVIVLGDRNGDLFVLRV